MHPLLSQGLRRSSCEQRLRHIDFHSASRWRDSTQLPRNSNCQPVTTISSCTFPVLHHSFTFQFIQPHRDYTMERPSSSESTAPMKRAPGSHLEGVFPKKMETTGPDERKYDFGEEAPEAAQSR